MSVKYFGTDAIAAEIRRRGQSATSWITCRQSRTSRYCSASVRDRVLQGSTASVREDDLDSLNERVNSRVVAGGRFLISSTRLRGQFSLRMCTLGFRTTQADIHTLFGELVAALAEELSVA